MSPLVTQGLFHVFFDAAFFVLAIKLWVHSGKTGNRIARSMAISFFLGGIEYLSLVLGILFFAHNQTAVKWLVGVFAQSTSVIAVAYGLPVIGYIFPRFPARLLMGLAVVYTVVSTLWNVFNYTPAGMNGLGMLDVSGPQIELMILSMMMLLIFVPIGLGFIYHTLKRRLYWAGFGLGAGLLIVIVFLPLTYQVLSYGAYLFFSWIAAAGFALLVGSVVLHPCLRSQKTSGTAR